MFGLDAAQKLEFKMDSNQNSPIRKMVSSRNSIFILVRVFCFVWLLYSCSASESVNSFDIRLKKGELFPIPIAVGNLNDFQIKRYVVQYCEKVDSMFCSIDMFPSSEGNIELYQHMFFMNYANIIEKLVEGKIYRASKDVNCEDFLGAMYQIIYNGETYFYWIDFRNAGKSLLNMDKEITQNYLHRDTLSFK